MLEKIEGPEGRVVSYEYNGLDLVKVVDALGNSYEYEYWPLTHNLKQIRNPEGACFCAAAAWGHVMSAGCRSAMPSRMVRTLAVHPDLCC